MIPQISTLLSLALWAGMACAQLDLNQASEMQLDGLNGLGPSTTRTLLNERAKAPFRDWPDLLQRVKGIGPKKAASLSAQGLQVQGQGFAQRPGPPADAVRPEPSR